MLRDPRFIGCIRIQPALNEAEQDFLLDLLVSGRTLRGTPTGRGVAEVPFAHLGWEVCADGCCLEWDPDLEDAKWMADTLRFVVDHLLRRGAKAEGHPRFGGFSFDHVLEGAVVGQTYAGRMRLVEVTGNVVRDREVLASCDDVLSAQQHLLPSSQPAGRPGAKRSTRVLPSNVIEFRPRRA